VIRTPRPVIARIAPAPEESLVPDLIAQERRVTAEIFGAPDREAERIEATPGIFNDWSSRAW
jgi:hypothetical protein